MAFTRVRSMVALLSLALALASQAARAAEPVDMLLVLAADVSRSVTEPKFKLQREGAAAAITHPDVVRAMGMSRSLLKIAQQALSVFEPMRPWRAVQGLG